MNYQSGGNKKSNSWHKFAQKYLLNGDASTGQQWEYALYILFMALTFILSVVLAFIEYSWYSLLVFVIFILILWKSYHFITKCEDNGLLITHHPVKDYAVITIVATPIIYTTIYSGLKSYIPTQSILMLIFCLLSLKDANDIDSKRKLSKKLNNISKFVGLTSVKNLKSSLKSDINNATNIDDLTNINNSLSSQLSSLSGKSNSASNYRSRINSAIDLLDDTSSLYSEIISKASAASNDANEANNLLNKNK